MTYRCSRPSITGIIALGMALAVAVMPSRKILAQSNEPAPGAAPTTGPAAPEARGFPQILGDIQRAGAEMQTVLTGPEMLTDPEKRKEAAPKAIPILKRIAGYGDELAALGDPQAKAVAEQMREQVQFTLALFGDPDALAQLDKTAAGSDATLATRAKAMRLMVQWMTSDKDATKQTKLLDEAAELARANPSSQEALAVLGQMAQMPAANEEVAKHGRELVEAVESARPPKSLENKPLVVAGTTPDGKPFSTEQWKGKVVLVDFWATWCGPCIAELPRVKKVYAEFHDKGLEILGVSNDFDLSALTGFLQKDPAMPWPQLFDAGAAAQREWNPITTSYGIDGIPTMFLIDKKGICRSVSAREDFEELIPKLLAESAD